jgi:prepilin-type N-terminal cleavage/methylation domain-containing protein
MKQKRKSANRKGITLIELICALVIIAMLASIVVPSFTGYIARAYKTSDEAKAKEIHNAVMLTLTDPNEYPYQANWGAPTEYLNPEESFYGKGSSYNLVSPEKVISGECLNRIWKQDFSDGSKDIFVPVATLPAYNAQYYNKAEKYKLNDNSGDKQKGEMKWRSVDSQQVPFINALNEFMGDEDGRVRIPIEYNHKVSNRVGLNTWIIGYWKKHPENVEIWVGAQDKTPAYSNIMGSPKPFFRLYPTPYYNDELARGGNQYLGVGETEPETESESETESVE